jgi:C4-dicarboxylate-specific signal transduction histidine kinase
MVPEKANRRAGTTPLMRARSAGFPSSPDSRSVLARAARYRIEVTRRKLAERELRATAERLSKLEQRERTLRKQLEEQQAELAHVLRLSTMGEFASLLAHELSQPFAAVVNYVTGCVRQLRAQVIPKADVLEMMEEAAAEALRGGEIIRHLWDFVRKRKPERGLVDLNRLVRDVTHLIGVEADHYAIPIHLELTQDLPRVEADRVQVEQVVLNLIRNGLEAMREKERNKAALIVRTGTTGRGDVIEISVIDCGTGLPAELSDSVFTPFVTTKPDGLGMGLSISRSIAEAHGGRVWLTSEPHGGTTARLLLPVAAEGSSE